VMVHAAPQGGDHDQGQREEVSEDAHVCSGLTPSPFLVGIRRQFREQY
jgi:hypothetical protein